MVSIYIRPSSVDRISQLKKTSTSKGVKGVFEIIFKGDSPSIKVCSAGIENLISAITLLETPGLQSDTETLLDETY